jgi:FkbM family methyltransferase
MRGIVVRRRRPTTPHSAHTVNGENRVARIARATMRSVAAVSGRLVPRAIIHRLTACSFALNREQRMLFLDDLVDPARTALDVGAWWGPWTFWLSRRCSEVWSFEPNPHLASVLRRVTRPNVHVEQVALADHHGMATLYVPSQLGDDAQATVEETHRLASAQAVDVATRTLDSYHINDVGFIKIDVEAHEPAMLRGAIETIRRCHPVVLIEIEQRFHAEPIDRIFTIFTDLGYTGWIRRDRAWVPLDSFSVDADQRRYERTPKSTRYINNFVFTPIGRAPGVTTVE